MDMKKSSVIISSIISSVVGYPGLVAVMTGMYRHDIAVQYKYKKFVFN
jgi:hypothetical protein